MFDRHAVALLALLVLLAGPAHAGPLTGFFSLLGGGGGWFAGAFGGNLGLLAGAGSLLGRLALSVGLQGLAARAQRRSQPSPADRMVNLSQPLVPMECVYGEVRKGGPVLFTGFRFPYRYYCVAIAAHSTDGPVEHWLDDFAVALDGAGAVTTAPVAGYGLIVTHTGQPGQVVDATLDAAFAEVDSSFDFAGLSYALIRARRPAGEDLTTVFPSGNPWVYAPLWRGDDRIYDPRDDSYKWTRNLALIIAKRIIHHRQPELLYPVQTGVDGGGAAVYAVPDADFATNVTCVDWDRVAAEADICDQVVTNRDGGTQARWTCDVTFSDTATWEECRQVFETCGDVWFCDTPDGRVEFMVGRYAAPVLTLTDTDFLSIEIADRAWGADVAGSFAMRYVEPAMNHVEHVSGAIVLEDNGRRFEDECWAINSHHQACRMADRLGRRDRARYTVSGTLKLIGYEAIGKRFLRVTHAGLGFDQVIEVTRLVINEDGISFDLGGRSVLSTDWDFDAADEPARPTRDTVASDGAVPELASLSGAVVTGTGGVAQIEWAWPAQDASLTQQLRMRRAGDADWQVTALSGDQTTLIVGGLVDGATYEAQIRNRSTSGAASGWAPLVPVEVDAVANTVAPDDLTSFAAVLNAGDIDLTWVRPNDPIYDGARIFRALGSTTFADAAVIHTEYATDAWTDTSPGSGAWSYWAEPINASGVPGTRLGPQTITIV